MGFGKKGSQDGDEDEAPVKGKRRSDFEKIGGGKERKEFVPTTKEELRAIEKRSRKRDKLAKTKKHERKSRNKGGAPRLGGDALRMALVERKPIRIMGNNFFDQFIEFCKENNNPKPRYKRYLERRAAESEFLFDIATATSRMSWSQLTELLHAAIAGDKSEPVGVATRTWTEASMFVQHCMYLALGVIEKKGILRLTDPSVLDDWPVEERKRKSKEDRDMSNAERRNASLKAKAKDDEEDEDEDEEDEDDEDGDEDEDEDDEDEDEKPKVKKKRGKFGKGKKKASKDDDDDDDDEDADDEDEDDDDDDEPKARKRGKGKKKASKKDDDEDEDEDEDEDDEDADDDEDEDDDDDKPTRKGKSVSKKDKKAAKSAKGKKAGKEPKKGKKPAKAEKGEKRTRGEPITEKTVVSKGSEDRDGGGKKQKFIDLIPKKGIAVKALVKEAKADDIDVDIETAIKWLKAFRSKGFIKSE